MPRPRALFRPHGMSVITVVTPVSFAVRRKQIVFSPFCDGNHLCTWCSHNVM